METGGSLSGTSDNDICPRNKSGNIKKKQTNVGSKWDESTKENSWQNI